MHAYMHTCMHEYMYAYNMGIYQYTTASWTHFKAWNVVHPKVKDQQQRPEPQKG